MKCIKKVSIAAACALGVGAAMAQNVQSRSSLPAAAAEQAPSRAPIQVAQAPAAGGASSGASTTSAIRITREDLLNTLGFVGVAVAIVAAAADENTATTHH